MSESIDYKAKCIECGDEDRNNFNFFKCKNKFNNRCKKCYAIFRSENVKRYAAKNKEAINKRWRERYIQANSDERKEKRKQYYKSNREALKASNKASYQKYRDINIQKRKEWYLNNKENHAKKRAEYEVNNKDRLRAARRKWENERLKKDIDYRLRKKLAGRIREASKGVYKKSKATEKLIGCTIEEFKVYIQLQFKKDMTWDNWNLYGWHIDHKKPLSWFDLSKESERVEAFHYTNMQPLWAADNIKKKNFYAHA